MGDIALGLAPPPLCPQASVAQQLCRQHVIAGQHMLEEGRGPSSTPLVDAGRAGDHCGSGGIQGKQGPWPGDRGVTGEGSSPGEERGSEQSLRAKGGCLESEPMSLCLVRNTPTNTKTSRSRHSPSTRLTTQRPTASSVVTALRVQPHRSSLGDPQGKLLFPSPVRWMTSGLR